MKIWLLQNKHEMFVYSEINSCICANAYFKRERTKWCVWDHQFRLSHGSVAPIFQTVQFFGPKMRNDKYNLHLLINLSGDMIHSRSRTPHSGPARVVVTRRNSENYYYYYWEWSSIGSAVHAHIPAAEVVCVVCVVLTRAKHARMNEYMSVFSMGRLWAHIEIVGQEKGVISQ